MMGLHDPENVNVEQITSSPVFTPSAINAKWIAAVPEFTTKQFSTEQVCAIRLSNSPIAGPAGATQFESKASFIKRISSPDKCGGER